MSYTSSPYAPKYAATVKQRAIERWKEQTAQMKNDLSEVDKQIESLELEAQSLRLQVRKMSVESVIKDIEADIIKHEDEIALLKKTKEEKVGEVINMEMIMDNIEYYLASLENLLLGSSDPLKRAAYFGVLFQVAPTYQELISGTAPLEPCIELNNFFLKGEGQMVILTGYCTD